MATNKFTKASLGAKKTTASIKPTAKPSVKAVSKPKPAASTSKVKAKRAALKAKRGPYSGG